MKRIHPLSFAHVRSFVKISVAAFAVLFAGCRPETPRRVEWPVMGTVAAVQTRGEIPPETVAAVRRIFADIETRLDAHDSGSELSRLAPLAEEEVLRRIDASVRPCLETAFRLRELTGGAFDPRWRGPGTLDLGAIAKGYALDVAAAALRPRCDLLLDLGGNLKAVRGNWRVGILGGGTFELKEGEACATSATYYRGKHIYDARTGTVATNGAASVTVVHPRRAELADGLSTALYILGSEKGTAFLRRHFPEATLRESGGMPGCSP